MKKQVPWQSIGLCCLTLFLICLLVAPGQAQVLYGSLTGNVTDASGAAVTGAKVEALNVRTGAVRDVATDQAGIYRFNALQPGIYKVTISASKFASSVAENVEVVVNNVKRVDSVLKVASQGENVTVTAEAPVLQTDKADVHTDLSSQQIVSLPTFGSQGRNFQSLLRLVPGVGLTAETNSISGNPQRAINANINGQSNQTVNTRIDGAQDLYPWLPANVAYVPPADAIETVNVVTNSFDAEQGMAGGAAVNVQIKTGTNSFHGSAHEFHTDQNFAARNYFQTDITRFPKKNRNNQNQFGGTLGGPILRDKLFFFTDFERTTQRGLAGPQTRTLPTAAMVQGDFRGLGVNIYDPLTGDATGANKQIVSCNGVQNVICPDRFDPASVQMIQLLQPSLDKVIATSNNLGNFSDSGTAEFTRDNFDVKVNYNPTQKATIFGRYSFSKSNVFDPPLLGEAGGDATAGGQLGTSPGLIQSVGLGGTYTFTPSLLLDWNFGFTRQRLGATFDLEEAKGLDLLHIPGTNGEGAPGDSTLYNGIPAFTFQLPSCSPNCGTATGAGLGNTNTGNPFLFRDNQFVSGLNLSWTKGKHNVRGGVEWNHAQINHFQPQGGTFQTARGSFQFTGGVTSLRGATPTWYNSWADFLFGLPSTVGKATALFNPVALRWSQWATYLRDQWQVTPRLTLNLGVRWEYYPFGYSDNDKGLRWFNPNDGRVYIGGFGDVPKDDGIDTGHGQFLPRVGFAYRISDSGVIRGGYGMSADPNNWRYFRNAYPSVVLTNNTQVSGNTADAVPAASLTGANGTGLGGGTYNVPTGIVTSAIPDISSGVVPLPQSVSTTTIPNPFHRGYINSFNLTYQQEVFRGLVLETSYVGARTIRPLVNMNLNASLPGTGSAGGLLSTSLTPTGVCAPSLACNYTGNINGEVPFKQNWYDSLQTKVTYQATQGSQAGFVWTWSKATDYQGNEELAALRFPHPDFWEKNRSVADFDRTHNFKIYGMFVPPFGKGQKWATSGWASRILGGFQVNPVISYLTGLPFTVGASGNLAANGSGQVADLIAPITYTGGQPPRTGVTCAQNDASCHFFDASAFAAPLITSAANAHYGNTRRNQFRGPSYFELDLSVSREFSLTERFKLQVRAEAFSLTNTPHFANPNVSCPGSATTPGPVAGSGGLCNTGSNNNFGVITGTLSPGGFFGPDPGSRSIWLGARVTF